MGLFSKLFGEAGKPKPDDYHLASSVASTIEGFISVYGFAKLIDGDWSVELGEDYDVSLTPTPISEKGRVMIRLNDLDEMSDLKRLQSNSLMANSVFASAATDQLAKAVLRQIREKVRIR